MEVPETMDDDGERAQLLQNILDLLLGGGQVDVDFDIFYDEDATLYYKIKVGEAIEEALQRMGCPHTLQAHQIQGLDYQAVLPVVQWLMKRVLATLDEFGDQARRYAHLRYQENYKLPNEKSVQHSRLENIEAEIQPSILQPLRKLADSNSVYEDQPVSSPVSAEQENSSTVLVPPFSRSSETSSPSLLNAHVSTRLQETEAHHPQLQILEKRIEVQDERIAKFQAEAQVAMLSMKELEQTVTQQDEHCAKAQEAIEELQVAAKVAGAEAVVQRLMELLERSKILEKQETKFRSECRRKRTEIQAHIKQLKDPVILAAKDEEHSAEVNHAYNIDLQKWNTVRSELSKRNRAIALLQRRLDEIPSQSELMQYERCFVELYLHIQRKLRETRKYYATYNALAEAHELTVKELSLLNSIHTQFETSMLTSGGRSKFVESMEGIAKGVQQKLHQIERRFEAEQATNIVLKEKHTVAVAAQRQYYSVVKLFQDECARSEKLQFKLEHIDQVKIQT